MSPVDGEPKRAEEKAVGDGPATSKGSKPEEPNLWALLGVGAELGIVTGLLALGGWWLDQHWKTAPWLMAIGATLGFVGGMYNLWKQVRKYL